MPITNGLTTAQTRLANTAFATTFFPRIMRSVWPRLCGTTKSSSMFEPFAFEGASPLLKLFQGVMQSQSIASFSMNVPNPVWKSIEIIKRNQFEFSQTKTLNARVGQVGVRVAQTWDYLLANQIVGGSAANSHKFVNPEDGKTYVMTFDNQPIFSASHNTGGTSTFSNIITGHLPTTNASVQNQDLTVTANQMQQDIQALITAIASITDDKGALLYPDFDPARQLILAVPPSLWAGAELAFRTQGTLGGSNGSSSGSTSNIGYRMVKDMFAWNLLGGVPDITSKIPGATVSPTFATQYYAFITDDFVRPWYFQRFVPLKDTIPSGYDPEAETERVLREANTSGLKVTPEAAEIYAATEIDSNLGALGANAQESVVTREEFFVSGRTRGMTFPGFWPCCWKIDPIASST